ncbi:hypothetical protein P8C59_004186 [Phyllachora maydis]|uniref:Arf-GAP domain-containing protein n=1 Tax=Phyllachora maydis TaxID=1825666 RepID=A0AAD9I376_9PEZI|nr:hypothetical protein P8C59_004186 [Phyllachora maydis]
MTTALSKRQAARNEKTLQDLVRNVPGNSLCADCQARNPTWASWSLGVFLCMRCAAIHRKLGTHVSKVKSLSMDSWSNEQVENMKKVGNVASNKNYNPQNKKPPTPIDADEADSAMERFIRSKYTNTTLGTTARHHTGSTESDETPPPLPPKTPGRFGFRSASSIFPLGSKSKKAARDGLSSPRELPASPRRGIVPSDMGTAGNFERKLARLRDMGFTDNQRNTIVLKGVNGSLERAVEALDYFAQHLQMSRAPQHVDTKASILALYSHPQLAGNAPQSQQQLPGQDHNQASADQSAPAQQQPQHQDPFAWAQTFPSQDQMQQQQQQQHNHYTTQNQGRAVSVSPAPGTNNPFLFNGSEASSPGPTKPASLHHQQQQAPPSLIDFTSKQNGSRDSMMATGLDWGSGRHSPDAFASLSARDVR